MTAPGTLAPATGVGSGEADLWCTYAAIRTLSWLGRPDAVVDPAGTAEFLLGRANGDGGYAWTRGMPSDAWATFYCTQALTDLGVALPHPERTARWLGSTFTDAYAMTPGQRPDVWATQFSTRTAIDLCAGEVPNRDRLLAWLGALQTAEGGLAWSPEHAATGAADVRACHYGITAWDRLAARAATPPPWDVPRLVGWLRAQQGGDGGFRFAPAADEPCLWATYRAASALALLGQRVAPATVDWVRRRRGPQGGFLRWAGYPVEDVWAAFCAVGTLRAAGAPIDEPDLVARISGYAAENGGYTYRERTHAADALTTSAAVLTAPDHPLAGAWRAFLGECQLPNEGGLMYMPGRGAEIRCTLWGLAAGATGADPARIAAWLRELQNPDGGFGLWEGRGSDLVSTVAAVDTAALLGRTLPEVVDPTALARFATEAVAPTLRTGLHRARVLAALGQDRRAEVAGLLATHQVAGGGFANTGNRVPDLLSTYEAALSADRLGVEIDRARLRRFVDRVSTADATAWSPLAPDDGGPLAHCLGTRLRRRLADPAAVLPALVLS